MSTSTNRKAIECLEHNEYDAALALFQEALNESRDVQSLNNLAWVYYHEEGDIEAALNLAKEAVELHPTSHFPYSLLGEMLVQKERWEEASAVLADSIAIEPSREAYNNLAACQIPSGRMERSRGFVPEKCIAFRLCNVQPYLLFDQAGKKQ